MHWNDLVQLKFLILTKGSIMKTKIVLTSLIASALLMPTIGYTAEGDSAGLWSYPVLQQVPDQPITSQVKWKIGSKMSYKDNVNIDSDNYGVVFLSGNVRSEAEKAQAESLARSVKGVTAVQNTIQVGPTTRM